MSTALKKDSSGEPLQLVCIEHERCSEIDAYTFVLAPSAWTEDQVQERVEAAVNAYLKALTAALKSEAPPNDYRGYGSPPYDKHPDRTVRDIKAEWEAKRQAWKAWDKERQAARTPFSRFLADEGFVSLWDASHARAEAWWGHRHGTPIDYSETVIDPVPSPNKMAERIRSGLEEQSRP